MTSLNKNRVIDKVHFWIWLRHPKTIYQSYIVFGDGVFKTHCSCWTFNECEPPPGLFRHFPFRRHLLSYTAFFTSTSCHCFCFALPAGRAIHKRDFTLYYITVTVKVWTDDEKGEWIGFSTIGEWGADEPESEKEKKICGLRFVVGLLIRKNRGGKAEKTPWRVFFFFGCCYYGNHHFKIMCRLPFTRPAHSSSKFTSRTRYAHNYLLWRVWTLVSIWLLYYTQLVSLGTYFIKYEYFIVIEVSLFAT